MSRPKSPRRRAPAGAAYVALPFLVPLGVACTRPAGPGDSACAAAAGAAPAAGDSVAAARWTQTARDLVVKYRTDPSARPYAVLALAQYAAATAAGRPAAVCASARAAVGGASVAALAYLYPAEAAALERQLGAQLAADAARGAADGGAAVALGRAAAAPVIERARADGSDAAWTGSVPTGPGMWASSAKPPTPPATPILAQTRPLVMASPAALRPAPPPAFGSAAFQQALAEVKALTSARTAAQAQLAQTWALSGGTPRTQGYWTQVASELVAARRMGELAATHVLAVLGAAMNDASIACFDAKYTYWLLRPSQADTSIVPSIALPNHPSYPSSHSCTSGAAAEALAAFFPEEKRRLDALADEIGISRVYAGIHYRFDVDAGTALGRSAGRLVVRADQAQGLPGASRQAASPRLGSVPRGVRAPPGTWGSRSRSEGAGTSRSGSTGRLPTTSSLGCGRSEPPRARRRRPARPGSQSARSTGRTTPRARAPTRPVRSRTPSTSSRRRTVRATTHGLTSPTARGVGTGHSAVSLTVLRRVIIGVLPRVRGRGSGASARRASCGPR